MMKTLEIDYEKDDLTSDIADRAVKLLGGRKIDHLLAVYNAKKGNPDMDLDKLLKSSDDEFISDMRGIKIFIDAESKTFKENYSPFCMSDEYISKSLKKEMERSFRISEILEECSTFRDSICLVVATLATYAQIKCGNKKDSIHTLKYSINKINDIIKELEK